MPPHVDLIRIGLLLKFAVTVRKVSFRFQSSFNKLPADGHSYDSVPGLMHRPQLPTMLNRAIDSHRISDSRRSPGLDSFSFSCRQYGVWRLFGARHVWFPLSNNNTCSSLLTARHVLLFANVPGTVTSCYAPLCFDLRNRQLRQLLPDFHHVTQTLVRLDPGERPA